MIIEPIKKAMHKIVSIIIYLILPFILINTAQAQSKLAALGLHVIPYPQEVTINGSDLVLTSPINIALDKGANQVDQKTAEMLKVELDKKWGLKATINADNAESSIILSRKASRSIKDQGYSLTAATGQVRISARDEHGLFYGVQTMLQLIKKNDGEVTIPGIEVTDWPDVKTRAVHYDTKHHQDKASYVKSFIRDLAKYKINMLVWEWEDKLAYRSHPEIGAPGAFSIEEMQEFTRYAREHHIELVPLVQGLGHVSFILKWPQYRHLREVADSDWEFCPLKEGVYDLLFDLWDEAIEATPGSEYIHIGSDETFELGHCHQCQKKAEEIGNSGLYHTFASKAAKHLKKSRKVMLWERPQGWEKNRSPIKAMKPDNDLVLTESYSYETPDFDYAKKSKALGFELFIYDPNPGLQPLFLPYYFRYRQKKKVDGTVINSYNLLSSSVESGVFDGMINTSWDDSGLHNQMWMLSFLTSAQYSWNAQAPGPEEFNQSFFASYYGSGATDMEELYSLLNGGAYYYAWTMERNVWHHGEIGKTHLPDLPRKQFIEYDPYWNTEYKQMVEWSEKENEKMTRALQIIDANKKRSLDHSYDFELYESIANLIRHTSLTYLDLSKLENTIKEAHKNAFLDRQQSLNSLNEAAGIVEATLSRRDSMYNGLVATWEKTRLPKGLSTPEKQYFFKMDRSRHFANRTADMSYLIYDEQLLDMEGYLERLKQYISQFQIEY
ncbi:MAG: hypothetical protein DHS20C17_21270 [Cyclobacteriaceae bacterium]|nr:MAG: hypothetical protein DHS20C17_21270 [Cyclobacteriaceae bacterium]